MNTVLWISLGAIIGANLRYYIGLLSQSISISFPYGTLIVNITGSFILALFLTWSSKHIHLNPKLFPLIAVGFCGSYTTFSSYSFETILLFEHGHYSLGLLNFFFNNLFCLLAVIAGSVVARAFQ